MLRIIAGEYRSRLLETPRDASTTRPLPDKVRGAMFNMLQGHIEGEAFVDVFAGVGSFGLEAISRGARECVFIERDRSVVELLRRNIESLGVGDRARIVQGDALGPAALAGMPRPTHVLLFDPPYPRMQDRERRPRVTEQFVRCAEALDEAGFALLRTPWPFEERALELAGMAGPETHAYGSTAVHWYQRAARRATAEPG